MGDFRKLKVWQLAHELTVKIYKFTSKLPDEEKFGLTLQLRRAAVSVESNIAEGESRYSNNDKSHFFTISRGSTSEIRTQLLVIVDVYENLGEEARILFKEYEVLGKKLTSLIQYRRKNPHTPTRL